MSGKERGWRLKWWAEQCAEAALYCPFEVGDVLKLKGDRQMYLVSRIAASHDGHPWEIEYDGLTAKGNVQRGTGAKLTPDHNPVKIGRYINGELVKDP